MQKQDSQSDEQDFQRQQEDADDDGLDSQDEGIEDYKLGGYHPVHIGEVLFNRYVIIQKLGWGHFSTVWLAKDFKNKDYVAVKIQKSSPHYLEAAYDQVQILQKVTKTKLDSEWRKSLKSYSPQKTQLNKDDTHVLGLLNCFLHRGPYGNHFCFVFQVLGPNLYDIIKRYNFKGIPLHLCRRLAKQILIGLDFLHRICGVIHTDLKPENVLIHLSKDQINQIVQNGRLSQSEAYIGRIEQFQRAHNIIIQQSSIVKQKKIRKQSQKIELQEIDKTGMTKSQRKNLRKRINKQKKLEQQQHQSVLEIPEDAEEQGPGLRIGGLGALETISFKNVRGPRLRNTCEVTIADLGNACWRHHHFASDIQTRQYRAPEVLIGANYDTSTDIWSFACMLFEIATGQVLFQPQRNIDYGKNQHHLALIQQKLGPLQNEFKWTGKRSKQYFDKTDRKLKHIKNIHQISLFKLLTHRFRFTQQQAHQFSQFLLPMLQLTPYKRISAQEALKHPWLNEPKKKYKMDDDEYSLFINSKDETIKPSSTQKQSLIDADISKSNSKASSDVGDGTRMVNVKLVDQSFTDLGYIGYCDGLDITELDQISNWQFHQ